MDMVSRKASGVLVFPGRAGSDIETHGAQSQTMTYDGRLQPGNRQTGGLVGPLLLVFRLGPEDERPLLPGIRQMGGIVGSLS